VSANRECSDEIVKTPLFNLENTIMSTFKRTTAFLAAITMMFMLGCASTAKHEGTGEYVDDTVITAKVKAKVLEEPGLKSAEINVETFKGVVQMSGFVSSQASINRAAELARSVNGVKSVKNDMRVK
jgi:osmotically-inducible protein OsmY